MPVPVLCLAAPGTSCSWTSKVTAPCGGEQVRSRGSCGERAPGRTSYSRVGAAARGFVLRLGVSTHLIWEHNSSGAGQGEPLGPSAAALRRPDVIGGGLDPSLSESPPLRILFCAAAHAPSAKASICDARPASSSAQPLSAMPGQPHAVRPGR